MAQLNNLLVLSDANILGKVNINNTLNINGNLTGKYLTGTWLQTTATTDLNKTPDRIPVLDGSGWLYYRTKDELASDLGSGEYAAQAQEIYYTGTGTWGSDNPCSVTFAFMPKFIAIESGAEWMHFAPPCSKCYSHISIYEGGWNKISYNGNTISWYVSAGKYSGSSWTSSVSDSVQAELQMNLLNSKYRIVGIG